MEPQNIHKEALNLRIEKLLRDTLGNSVEISALVLDKIHLEVNEYFKERESKSQDYYGIQKKLEESNSQISNILGSISDAFFALDNNFIVTYFNTAAEQVLNKKANEVLGKPLFDSFPEARGSVSEVEYTLAMNEKTVRHFETYFPIKPYENWYDVRVYPQENGITVYFQVITERKSLERKIIDHQRVMFDILESTLSGYWDWNLQNNTEYLSPAFKKMFGYEDYELPNSPDTWQKLIFQEDLQGVFDIYEKHVKSKGQIPFYNEVRYRHKNGSTIWIICAGRIIEWANDGTPVRMVGCHVDITSQKRMEEQLRLEEIKLKEKNEELIQTNEKLRITSNKLFDSELKLKEQVEEYTALNEELNQSNQELRDIMEELTESNLRTNALVAANPDLMFVFSRQGEFLDYHAPKPGLLLLKPEGFLHKRVGEVLPDFLANLNQDAINKLFETGIAQNYSYMLDVNGNQFHFDARMVKYGNDKALAIVRDITTEKQAEISIAKSEEKFRLLVKNSSDTISILNAEGKQIYISPVVERVTGYKVEELLGTRIDEVIHPDDLQMVMEHWQELLLNPSEIQIANYRHIHKTLGWVYLEAIGQNFLAEPSVNGIVLSVRDINERKKAELALQASEEKYRMLFESMSEGVFYQNADGTIIDANQAALNQFGLSEAEFFGRTSYSAEWKVIDSDGNEMTPEQYPSTISLATGKPVLNFELGVYNPTKSDYTWLLVNAIPIQWKSEKNESVVFVTMSNITARKQFEQTLKQKNTFIQTVLDNLPIGVALNKMDEGGATYMNKKFQEIYGWGVDELDSISSFFEKVYPDEEYRNQLISRIMSDIHSGNSDRMKWEGIKVTRKDGAHRVVNAVNIPLTEQNTMVSTVIDVTMQKLAEQALKQSEEQYRLLFENMTQGFALHEIIVDKNNKPYDYRYLSVNPAFEQLTGLKSSNLIGKTVLEVLPNTEAYWIETYGKVAQTQEAIRYENFSAELGKYYEVSAFSPKKGQFAVVFSDITKRKLAEEKVQKLSKGIEQSPAIVVITDCNGIIEYVNPKFTEVTGYSFNEVIGQSPRILKSGYHNGEFYQNLWNTILSGNDWSGEILNKKKNGEEYWESALISSVKNEKGEVKNFIAIKEDITERKKTIIALEQNNQLINAMLDNLPVGIFMVDSKYGKPLIANEHAKILMGRGIIADATVDSLAEVYKAYIAGTNEPYPTNKMPIVQGMSGIASYIDDLEVEHPDGSRILLEIFGSPVRNSEGVTWASLVGFHDITERKKEQEALKQSELIFKEKNEEYLALNEELVESNERISKINAELIVSREKAEESDRLKTAFLANMSHEIRTPMNAIIGFSEVLLKPTLSDEKQKFFTSVLNEACQQLLTVVNDVIDIAKVETKQVKVYHSDVDINKVLQKAHSLFSQNAEKKGNLISLSFGLPNSSCIVVADETKLGQIINNLLSNAIKFTTDGEIELGYRVENKFVKFYVKDSGIGISPDHHKIVFERFRQVEVDDSRKFGGTGLGLSISKAFVELMGGQIWVESELGKGAVFFFTIPFIPVKKEKQQEIYNATDNFNLNGKIIILAEDEQANYLLINAWLEEANAKILYAVNGIEAIALYEKNPQCDLILMDIKMPEMNGLEATKFIKAINKNVPIIALTAYAMAGDKEKCLEAGCNGYLSKPIKRQELFNLIAAYLG